MSRVRFDADKWYNRRYKSVVPPNFWQNKESLEKYVSRLRELMAKDGDKGAIKSIAESPKYKISLNNGNRETDAR